MKELKQITEEMLQKELVDTLNHNFQKLDEDAKQHRTYVKGRLDSLSGSIRELNAKFDTLQSDVSDVRDSLNLIITYLRSDNDKTLLIDSKK